MSLPMATLKSGAKFPLLAFGAGTALYNQDAQHAVQQALSAGFNAIDGAEMYRNAESVGKALSSHKDSNEKIYILDKIGDMKRIYDVAMEEKNKLKIDKFDALLLHSPPRGKDGKPSNVEAWKTMEKLKDEGVADIIGVSNWYSSDIEEVLQSNPKHHIEINQMEFHPAIAASPKYQKLLQLCKKEQIVLMTYASLAPLTKLGDESGPLLSILDEVAAKEQDWNKGTVLQKWASQYGATCSDAIITSTSNKESRLKEYLSTFKSRKLTSEEVDKITKAGEQVKQTKIYMVNFYEEGQ